MVSSDMPKKPKLRADVNEVAFRIVAAVTGDGPKPQPPGGAEKNPEAVKRGRKGGKKGGTARNDVLSDTERQGIARNAANARWRNRPAS